MILTILLYIFILVILLLLVSAYYFGVFKKITTQKQMIGPYKILYLQVQDNYASTGKYFEKILEIKLAENLINCDTMGLYYDNPYSIADPNQCRSCACLVINDCLKEEKIEEICKKYKNVSFAELPKTMAIAANEFIYRGFLTFFVFPFKVYPKISEFFKTLPEGETEHSCSIEYYPRDPKDPKNFLSIIGYMPLTAEAAKYCISKFPKPLQKGEEEDKKKK